MARINLLPWRDELRRQRQNEFLAMVGASVGAGLFIGLVLHLVHVRLIGYQDSRNEFLEGQIQILDKRIAEIEALEDEKEQLLQRMRAIEQLQGNRPLNVRLLDELVKTMPEGVSLISLVQKENKLTFKGIAQSNARISNLMKNIEESQWLRNPALQVIEVKGAEGGGGRQSHFTLAVEQVLPVSDADRETA